MGTNSAFLKSENPTCFSFIRGLWHWFTVLCLAAVLKDDNIQIIFVVSCQKKREKKKKKTRFVLKSQSCNYLNESSKMLLGETFISFGISSSQSNVI